MSTLTYTHSPATHTQHRNTYRSSNESLFHSIENNAERSKYHQLFDWIDLCRRRRWNAKEKQTNTDVFLFIAAYVLLLLSLTQFYRMSMGIRFSFFFSTLYSFQRVRHCAALRFYRSMYSACVRYFCFNSLVSVCFYSFVSWISLIWFIQFARKITALRLASCAWS